MKNDILIPIGCWWYDEKVSIRICHCLDFGIQAIVKHYRGGQLITYMVSEKGTKYKITENYTKRKKNNRNAYYFDIKANDEHFIFQTYESFGHQQNLIQAIHEYRDDQVQCILPVLKENKVVTDMICKEQEDQIYYREIHGKYEIVTRSISHISKKGKYSESGNF